MKNNLLVKFTGHFTGRVLFWHLFYLMCFYMGTEKLWHFQRVSHPMLSVILSDPDDTVKCLFSVYG